MFDGKVSALCVSESLNLTGISGVVTRWGFFEYDGVQTVGRLREAQVLVQ